MADSVDISTVADGAAALALECGRIAKSLSDLAEGYRDAESLLSTIAKELSTTQRAWQLIRKLIDPWKSQGHLSQDLLLRVDQCIAWGRLVLAALDDDMSSSTRRLAMTTDGLSNQLCRSSLLWSETSLKRHQERTKSLTISMGLLISILKTIDRFNVFDDIMYDQLRIDKDIFTSHISKPKYRSQGHTNSSPPGQSTIQAGTRRASTHVASQMKPCTRQPLSSTGPASTQTAPVDSNSFAPATHLDAIQETQSEEDNLSGQTCLPPSPDAGRGILDQVQDQTALQSLISDHPTPGMTETVHDRDLEGVLLDACRRGLTRLVEELLRAGVDVHCRRKETDDRVGSTPIHIAAMYGQLDVVRILLGHHACVNDHHHGERRPLHEAAEAGYDTMTAFLLENGARPYLRDSQGLLPLHLACHHGSMKVARLLLDAGSAVDAADNDLYRPIHHLAQQCDNPYLATVLVDAGCDINASTRQGYTAVQLACTSGNINVLAILLHRGASMASLTWSASPLNLAIRGGHSKVIQLLLRNGAQVNDMDPITHATASHLIIKEAGSTKMVKKLVRLLLEYGLDINALDAEGNTSLHLAAADHSATKTAEWQLIVAKFLLVNGADTGLANFKGDFPLDSAVRLTLARPSHDIRLFRLLLAASMHHLPNRELARIEREMRHSDTPVDRARGKEMAALLGTARIASDLDV